MRIKLWSVDDSSAYMLKYITYSRRYMTFFMHSLPKLEGIFLYHINANSQWIFRNITFLHKTHSLQFCALYKAFLHYGIRLTFVKWQQITDHQFKTSDQLSWIGSQEPFNGELLLHMRDIPADMGSFYGSYRFILPALQVYPTCHWHVCSCWTYTALTKTSQK